MGATVRTTISLPKIILLILTGLTPAGMQGALAQSNDGYNELLRLFEDWRQFEAPPLLDGAPDYTAGAVCRCHCIQHVPNKLIQFWR